MKHAPKTSINAEKVPISRKSPVKSGEKGSENDFSLSMGFQQENEKQTQKEEEE